MRQWRRKLRRKLSRSSARLLQRRWESSRHLRSWLRRKKTGQGLRQWKRPTKREPLLKPKIRLARVRRERKTRSHLKQVECCSLAPSSSTWTRTRRMEWRKIQNLRQVKQRRTKAATKKVDSAESAPMEEEERLKAGQ